VIRSHYRKGFLKQYVRDRFILRTETATNNISTDYGIGKAVENLPQLRKRLDGIIDRYLDVPQDILETFVDREELRQLTQPTVLPNGRRIPGLELDQPRQLALMHSLVRFCYLAAEGTFTTRDLYPQTLQALQRTPEEYKLGSLRYDLWKLRAKGLVEKIPHSRRYRLLAHGYQICLVFLKLYEKIYAYRNDAASFAWGAEESVSESWRRKRRRQVQFVKPLITEEEGPSDAVLCDISAGAGYYTLAYAHLFRHVLHCDLSISNLSYVWRKAREMGIWNIFFIRADYIALPFFHSLDRVLCLDTLIRGEAHETLLLASIERSLKPTGVAVVDFHNWWHNPLRRIGFLPENFRNNRSYRRSEAERLLSQAGIKQFVLHPFVQEFDGDDAVAARLSWLLPPTRLVYRIASSREPSPPLAGTRAKGAHP